MLSIMFKFFQFLILFIFYPKVAFAYFDPGMGSYILQLIIAFIASCYFFITNPKIFFKNLLKKFKKKEQDDKKDQS